MNENGPKISKTFVVFQDEICKEEKDIEMAVDKGLSLLVLAEHIWLGLLLLTTIHPFHLYYK